MTIDRKGVLLTLSVTRALVYLAAIPLAPVLYKDHFLVLVLLRPSKEVFLAAGFALRRGDIGLPELVAAALPLSVLGVWLFFFLALAHSEDIKKDRLHGTLGRVMPARKVNELRKAMKKKGRRFIILGRLAVIASTLIGSAAGTMGMKARDFLPADMLGALLSFAVSVAAGYALGQTYEQAGPWLTGAGVAALAASSFFLARYLKRV